MSGLSGSETRGRDRDSNAEFHEQLRLQQQYENGGGAEVGAGDTFTDADGAEYEWDSERGAWFPRITEDFLAAYQASYGFREDGGEVGGEGEAVGERPEPGGEEVSERSEAGGGQKVSRRSEPGSPQVSDEPRKSGEKRKVDQGWTDVEAQKNTSVYVSGLPPDMSTEEFVELVSKFGIVMRDPETEEHKVKLYKDQDGNPKGDGLCCYLKRESVGLALKLMDDTDLRGHRLRVEPARFELKGKYDASKKRKKSKDYRKKLLRQKKQLDWKPEAKPGETRLRHHRVVVIKNMFHPKEIEEDALVLNEIREDLRLECEKFGQVKKVLVFDRHPDGVASVAFKEPEEADQCIRMLNGRWFAGRQIVAETWDGQVDYQIEETVREREERLKSWSAYLHQDTPADPPSGVQNVPQSSSGVSGEVPATSEVKSSSGLDSEGSDTIVTSENKGGILPAESKDTIATSENKGGILPAESKDTIATSENKGGILPAESKDTIVASENLGSALPAEGKATVVTSEGKGSSLPSESNGSTFPSGGKAYVEDSAPQARPDEDADVQGTEEEEKWNEDNLSTDSSMGGSDEEP